MREVALFQMCQCLVDQNTEEMVTAVFDQLICEREDDIFYKFPQHPSLNAPFDFDEADHKKDACRKAITR